MEYNRKGNNELIDYVRNHEEYLREQKNKTKYNERTSENIKERRNKSSNKLIVDNHCKYKDKNKDYLKNELNNKYDEYYNYNNGKDNNYENYFNYEKDNEKEFYNNLKKKNEELKKLIIKKDGMIKDLVDKLKVQQKTIHEMSKALEKYHKIVKEKDKKLKSALNNKTKDSSCNNNNNDNNIFFYVDDDDNNFNNFDFNEKLEEQMAIQAVEQQIMNEICPNPDSMSYEQLLNLEEKVGEVKKGLTKKQIEKLPIIKFSKKLFTDHYNCVICMDNFKDKEIVKELPCGHKFHKDCIGQWLTNSKTCPFCKGEVRI